MRGPDALDADHKLKEQQELWEAERKKKRYKTTSTVTSGKKLMFKGSGKCPTVKERVDESVEEHCSSHGGNRGYSRVSTRAWPEPDPTRKVERYKRVQSRMPSERQQQTDDKHVDMGPIDDCTRSDQTEPIEDCTPSKGLGEGTHPQRHRTSRESDGTEPVKGGGLRDPNPQSNRSAGGHEARGDIVESPLRDAAAEQGDRPSIGDLKKARLRRAILRGKLRPERQAGKPTRTSNTSAEKETPNTECFEVKRKKWAVLRKKMRLEQQAQQRRAPVTGQSTRVRVKRDRLSVCTPRASKGKCIRLVRRQTIRQRLPFGATKGCPVETGPAWTEEQINAAIK